MWPRRSRSGAGIEEGLGLSEHGVTHERAQCSFGQEVDRTPEERRQPVFRSDQLEKADWGLEVDQEIDIRSGRVFASGCGPEDPESGDAIVASEGSEVLSIELDHGSSLRGQSATVNRFQVRLTVHSGRAISEPGHRLTVRDSAAAARLVARPRPNVHTAERSIGPEGSEVDRWL